MTLPSGVVTIAHAEKLLRKLSISSLPIDPFIIAANHDIVVQPKPETASGISGLLMQVGSTVGIMYATHIPNEGYQRFSVAHELGHYFLPGHIDAVLANRGVHESRAGFVSEDKYEREADYFAAGLLMPKSLFSPALRSAGSGLAAVEKLHVLCRTSLTATAIRATQCTRDPMAVVVSTGKSIDYCFMSDELKELRGIDWIRKRQFVPSGTPTFEFNSNPANIQHSARVEGTSNLQDWFGGNRSVEVSEDVTGLGKYGKTLTILYGIELPDEEDEAEEESLIESWTPRFRK